MTDTTLTEAIAEKMRDAAAKACDRIAGNTADFRHEYRRAAGQCAAMIRDLPIPNSNPLVDVNETGFCEHQTGLVLTGERKADVSAGLLDEVKTALRAAGDALADSQWSPASAFCLPAPSVDQRDQPRACNHHAVIRRRCQSLRMIGPRRPCPDAHRLMAPGGRAYASRHAACQYQQ